NRRALNERLEYEFLLAQRHTLPLSVLLLDVDHFKAYNDNFGHLAGDSVLQRLAEEVSHCTRETDFFARYGGEEFCLLLPQTDEDGALHLAERIHAAVSTLVELHQPITVSIGGATFSPAITSSSQLLAQADHMLYLAKRAGRNGTRHARESLLVLNQR
nr:GGDEF domain-containing protein [Chloroflexaceae bacterium]